MKLLREQALYLSDKLLGLAENQKETAWREQRNSVGWSEEYVNGVWLYEQVRIYRSGLLLELPFCWLKYKKILEEFEELKKQGNNPEYLKYLELRKKFEGV